MMDDIMRKMAEKIEADLFTALCGPARKQPQTALMLRGNLIIAVELDDAGKPILPCPKCGPVLLCAEHMAMVA